DSRLSALHSLSRTDTKAASGILQQWIPESNTEQKKMIATVLSGSNEGSKLLIDLYGKNQIDLASFDVSAAERVHNSDPGNAGGTAILEGVKKHIEDEKKAFSAKLSKYMAIAEKKSGNAANGKAMFQMCLSCHRVGD